ncbi:MAG: globin [Steroidobacteraceae bacterium]
MNLNWDAELPTTHGCQSGASGFVVGAEVRWVEGKHELEFPPVPFPSRRIIELAGASTLRALVLRHHQRLYETPLRALFPANRERFLAGVARAADYAIETCGGPRYFTSRRGKPCMRRRHYPFTIDEAAREVWLRELWLAFDDVGFPAQLRREYWEWVEAFSIRMINRRTQRAQPRRFPFADMPGRLLQVEVARDPAGHVAMV